MRCIITCRKRASSFRASGEFLSDMKFADIYIKSLPEHRATRPRNSFAGLQSSGFCRAQGCCAFSQFNRLNKPPVALFASIGRREECNQLHSVVLKFCNRTTNYSFFHCPPFLAACILFTLNGCMSNHKMCVPSITEIPDHPSSLSRHNHINA